MSQVAAINVSVATLSLITMFYNGTEAEFNTAFAEFLTIPAITKTLGPLSYNDITKVLPAGNERTNAVSTLPLRLSSLADQSLIRRTWYIPPRELHPYDLI